MLGDLHWNYWDFNHFPGPLHPSPTEVGAIRSREKPCSHGFRVSFSSRGRWAEGGLLPGIPGDPRLFRRASKAAIRRCNWAMAALCSTMIASRVSLLAVARSSSVFTLVVYHY
jgi:hypothetical protein